MQSDDRATQEQLAAQLRSYGALLEQLLVERHDAAALMQFARSLAPLPAAPSMRAQTAAALAMRNTTRLQSAADMGLPPHVETRNDRTPALVYMLANAAQLGQPPESVFRGGPLAEHTRVHAALALLTAPAEFVEQHVLHNDAALEARAVLTRAMLPVLHNTRAGDDNRYTQADQLQHRLDAVRLLTDPYVMAALVLDGTETRAERTLALAAQRSLSADDTRELEQLIAECAATLQLRAPHTDTQPFGPPGDAARIIAADIEDFRVLAERLERVVFARYGAEPLLPVAREYVRAEMPQWAQFAAWHQLRMEHLREAAASPEVRDQDRFAVVLLRRAGVDTAVAEMQQAQTSGAVARSRMFGALSAAQVAQLLDDARTALYATNSAFAAAQQHRAQLLLAALHSVLAAYDAFAHPDDDDDEATLRDAEIAAAQRALAALEPDGLPLAAYAEPAYAQQVDTAREVLGNFLAGRAQRVDFDARWSELARLLDALEDEVRGPTRPFAAAPGAAPAAAELCGAECAACSVETTRRAEVALSAHVFRVPACSPECAARLRVATVREALPDGALAVRFAHTDTDRVITLHDAPPAPDADTLRSLHGAVVVAAMRSSQAARVFTAAHGDLAAALRK